MLYPPHAKTLRRFLIAATLALLTACGENLSTEELLARARGSLEAGDVNAAVIDVKSALQDAPGNAAGRRLYGEILLYQRDLPGAAEQFRRSLDSFFDPQVAVLYASALVENGEQQKLIELSEGGFFAEVENEPAFLAARARAELADGNFFAAADTIDQAEAIDGSLPVVRIARARVLAQQDGDLSAAETVMESLVAEWPDNADAWSFYGSLLQAQNKFSDAEAAFARAGEINPHRLEDRLSQLMLLIKEERYDEVQSVIDQIGELLPNNPRVNYAQARLAMNSGDPDQAVEELDAVLRVAPQHTPSLYLAANANFRRGNLVMAQSQVESFLALRPSNINGRLMLAAIHLEQAQPAKALEIARQVINDRPDNETARRVYATALAQEGLHEESAAAYAEVVALNPESASLRGEYSAALLRAQQPDLAVAELERALQLEPDDPDLRIMLISARIAQGNMEAARADITSFSAAFPDSPKPELLLAQVSLGEQDTEGARRHLQAALEADPDNPAVRRSLASLAMREDGLEEAAAILGEDLDQGKPDLLNLIRLAGVEERLGDAEAMEQALRSAIDIYPEAVEPRILLARHMLRLGRAGEAVDLLTTVRENHEDDPRLQRLLVGAFMALDQPGAAVNAGRKLARLQPEDPVALRLAGRAELMDNNLPEAEQLFRKSLRISPANLKTHMLLLGVLVQQGDARDAGEQMARINEAFADQELLVFSRGQLALKLDAGDLNAAEGVLRKAYQMQPNTVSVLFLGATLLRNGSPGDSVKFLDEWVESHPKDGAVLDQLGALRAMRGEDQEAAEAYEKYLALYPIDPVAMNNLAWSLREIEPQRAIEVADRALKQVPDASAIKDTKAMALMYSGEYDSALAILDEVAEQHGELPPLAMHRAQVLIAAGRKDEARLVLERVAGGDPSPEQERAKALLDTL